MNTPLAVQTIEHAEYLARKIGAIADAPVDVIVTDPPEIVVNPTPIDCRLMTSPALKVDAGIVTVTAPAFEVVTHLPTSDA